jgi:hypothetical protein
MFPESRRRVIIRRLMGRWRHGSNVREVENSKLGWENGPPESQTRPLACIGLRMRDGACRKKGAILVIILRGLRRHRASPDHVRVVGTCQNRSCPA